jgi:hypothetical protein
VLSGDTIGLHDLVGAPDAGTPVKHLTLSNQVGHYSHRLLDWSLRVRTMTKEEIQIIDLEPFQGCMARFKYMFAA